MESRQKPVMGMKEFLACIFNTNPKENNEMEIANTNNNKAGNIEVNTKEDAMVPAGIIGFPGVHGYREDFILETDNPLSWEEYNEMTDTVVEAMFFKLDEIEARRDAKGLTRLHTSERKVDYCLLVENDTTGSCFFGRPYQDPHTD